MISGMGMLHRQIFKRGSRISHQVSFLPPPNARARCIGGLASGDDGYAPRLREAKATLLTVHCGV